MGGKISSLRAVLQQSLRDLGLEQRLKGEQVRVVWPQVVGPAVAKIAHPTQMRAGTLFIEVADSVWMQELKLQERELREHLNDALGEPLVKRLFLRLGDIPMVPVVQDTQATRQVQEDMPLDPKQEALLEHEVVGVRDPELRAVLIHFRRRMLLSASPVQRPRSNV